MAEKRVKTMDEFTYEFTITDVADTCYCDQDSGIDEAPPSMVGDVLSSADEDSVDDDLTVVSVDNTDSDDTVSVSCPLQPEASPAVDEKKPMYPDDCPVVSANDAVAYYDVLTVAQRGRSPRKPRNPTADTKMATIQHDATEQVRTFLPTQQHLRCR